MKRFFKALLTELFWPITVILVLFIAILSYGWYFDNMNAPAAGYGIGFALFTLIVFVAFCFWFKIWDYEKEAPMRRRRRPRR